MDFETVKKYIDVKTGTARLMGNASLYKKLLSSFLKARYADDLRENMTKGDLEAAEQAAHALKGLCANLSLSALYELTQELDRKLKNGSGFEADYAAFDPVFNETVSAINFVVKNI